MESYINSINYFGGIEMDKKMIENIFKRYSKTLLYDKIINNGEYLIERVFVNMSERDIDIIIIRYSSEKINVYDILLEKYNLSKARIGQIIASFNYHLDKEIDILENKIKYVTEI